MDRFVASVVAAKVCTADDVHAAVREELEMIFERTDRAFTEDEQRKAKRDFVAPKNVMSVRTARLAAQQIAKAYAFALEHPRANRPTTTCEIVQPLGVRKELSEKRRRAAAARKGKSLDTPRKVSRRCYRRRLRARNTVGGVRRRL